MAGRRAPQCLLAVRWCLDDMRDVLKRSHMDQWSKCLRKIQHNAYNKVYRWKNRWFKKLETICKDWNHFAYQLNGVKQKKAMPIKQYSIMDERLKYCLQCWKDKRKIKGWTQTLENMRSNWRDRGKYIRGRSS